MVEFQAFAATAIDAGPAITPPDSMPNVLWDGLPTLGRRLRWSGFVDDDYYAPPHELVLQVDRSLSAALRCDDNGRNTGQSTGAPFDLLHHSIAFEWLEDARQLQERADRAGTIPATREARNDDRECPCVARRH